MQMVILLTKLHRGKCLFNCAYLKIDSSPKPQQSRHIEAVSVKKGKMGPQVREG